jgi:hypothetical protein
LIVSTTIFFCYFYYRWHQPEEQLWKLVLDFSVKLFVCSIWTHFFVYMISITNSALGEKSNFILIFPMSI